MSALTGVGPAMASGSHVCSGSCADFPTAPPSSSSAAATAAVEPTAHAPGAAVRIAGISSVPNCQNKRNSPMASATSPMRVTMNAFIAAAPFSGFLYQKPMSR
ncbi:MAG: hypothetical protein BWY76_03132 [bacterium ADurb.Bin429]|nr:MAG: hypothetical protein BWY76_03132 [bacterium ADurb.Bin429]